MDKLHSLAQKIAANPTRIPNSFGGDQMLYGAKLFEMTAATYLAVMFAGWIAYTVWTDRDESKWNHPVNVFRAGLFIGSVGMVLRTGGEAALLWSWTSRDAVTTARVTMIRNWTDLIGVGFYLAFMVLGVLTYRAMVGHLKRRPFPVRMWEQRSKLVRPALVVLASLGMAVAVVIYR